MAENERVASNQPTSKWPEEIVEASGAADENRSAGNQDQQTKTTTTGSTTNLKSSWSGWFQRMNDALANAVADEEEEEQHQGGEKDGKSAEAKNPGDTKTRKKAEEKEENHEEAERQAAEIGGEQNPSGTTNDHHRNNQEESSSSSWSKWGSSFLKQAKEKTMTTLELVKKDLSEFSDVVQNETANIVTNTASTFRERAPGLVGTIVGTVNNVLLVEDTTRGEESLEVPITAEQAAAICSNRAQARLYAIQTDPGTYCNEPEGAPELFDDWLDHSFNLQERRDEIAQLLVNNPALRNLYVKLVPLEVSNTIFWQRYFYKLHQLELDEARRQALLKREDTTVTASVDQQHLRLSWGDESEPDGTVEQVEKAETESFCDLTPDGLGADSPSPLLAEGRSSPAASPPVVVTPPPAAPAPAAAAAAAARKSSPPLCGRAPPDGVSAIPKKEKAKKKKKGQGNKTASAEDEEEEEVGIVVDSFNVEMEKAEATNAEENAVKSSGMHDVLDSAEVGSGSEARSSPTDKKSDDWVEWEDNGASSN